SAVVATDPEAARARGRTRDADRSRSCPHGEAVRAGASPEGGLRVRPSDVRVGDGRVGRLGDGDALTSSRAESRRLPWKYRWSYFFSLTAWAWLGLVFWPWSDWVWRVLSVVMIGLNGPVFLRQRSRGLDELRRVE